MISEATPDESLHVGITKTFRSPKGPDFTLAAEFSAPPGFTILFGASGAGKTTVLDCIAGLRLSDDGRISIGDYVLFDSQRRKNLPLNRRSIGYLLQSLALFPHMTVRQNVEYGLAALDHKERRTRSNAMLESFRISSLSKRRPGEISGGERQRVALARALVTRPRALLLDEPLTALDAVTKTQIVDDLRTWNRQNNIPILYVTHDREEVFSLGEGVIVLENGNVIAQGPPQQVLRRPQSTVVAQLAGYENIFVCAVTGVHPDQGTMTCRIAGSPLDIEAPLTRVNAAQPLQLGIRAGDILLASSPPRGLSARNVIAGVVAELQQQDAKVVAVVDCGPGPRFEVHLTLGGATSLQLQQGSRVWLVIKTYSCHLLQ